MNNNCEYAGSGGGCLCSACQSMRRALEDVEKITHEEIDEVFKEAEKTFEDMKSQEEGKH